MGLSYHEQLLLGVVIFFNSANIEPESFVLIMECFWIYFSLMFVLILTKRYLAIDIYNVIPINAYPVLP
jgi:hypothetical protein